MDSEAIVNSSKTFRVFILIISAVNLILFFSLFFAAWDHYKNAPYDDSRPAICMIMILIVLYLVGILKLMRAVWFRKIFHIKDYLEYFIVLFVLNIIPMISKEKKDDFDFKYSCFGSDQFRSCNLVKEYTTKDNKGAYNFILLSCKIFYVLIGLEIYFVYLYYNYELKSLLQNISPAPPSCENPSTPTEQSQMASSHNQTHQCTSQPVVQNATCQPGQSITQPLQYVIQQPGQYVTQPLEQYVTQQPVSSSHIMQIPMQPPHILQMPTHLPHIVQMSSRAHQNMPNKPRQDLNLQSEEPITQKSVMLTSNPNSLTSNPPPYSKSEDM